MTSGDTTRLQSSALLKGTIQHFRWRVYVLFRSEFVQWRGSRNTIQRTDSATVLRQVLIPNRSQRHVSFIPLKVVAFSGHSHEWRFFRGTAIRPVHCGWVALVQLVSRLSIPVVSGVWNPMPVRQLGLALWKGSGPRCVFSAFSHCLTFCALLPPRP